MHLPARREQSVTLTGLVLQRVQTFASFCDFVDVFPHDADGLIDLRLKLSGLLRLISDDRPQLVVGEPTYRVVLVALSSLTRRRLAARVGGGGAGGDVGVVRFGRPVMGRTVSAMCSRERGAEHTCFSVDRGSRGEQRQSTPAR